MCFLIRDDLSMRLENPTSTNFAIEFDTLDQKSTQDIHISNLNQDRLEFMLEQGVEFKGLVIDDKLYDICPMEEKCSSGADKQKVQELQKEVDRLEKELEEAQTQAEEASETEEEEKEEEKEEETSEEGEEESESGSYEDKTVSELRDLLRERDLKVSGNKGELVDRLVEDDVS